jgi:hypothetical protein
MWAALVAARRLPAQRVEDAQAGLGQLATLKVSVLAMDRASEWAPAASAAPTHHRLLDGAGGGITAVERRRWAPVASLILPGTGQALLHQDRFVAYLALEAWGLLEFANQRQEARRQQEDYRALAREVARSLFGGARPVGAWAYYESMEHYLESGVFDRLPGGDVDPETDESTYNGAMWLLARTTYWVDPTTPPSTASSEYRLAMNFYLDRAVRAEYRWSWRNAQLQQDLYVRAIRRANRSFKGARAALGALLANHLLSSVDAFVTLRIEGLDGAAGSGIAVRGSIPIR